VLANGPPDAAGLKEVASTGVTMVGTGAAFRHRLAPYDTRASRVTR
jgi:hypothetical protein